MDSIHITGEKIPSILLLRLALHHSLWSASHDLGCALTFQATHPAACQWLRQSHQIAPARNICALCIHVCLQAGLAWP